VAPSQRPVKFGWPAAILALVAVLPFGCELPRVWVATLIRTDAPPQGQADDASRMNRTAVAEVWSIPADAATAEAQLRKLLARARAEKLTVAIAGAKHSMGGHTISPGGIVVDMLPFKRMDLDAAKGLLHVGAGARWSDIVPYLDARGYSVAVMQSNNDFSVGGSISVNCHGWQHNHPPIASTVVSLRLMKSDGAIVRCSRDENSELFSLVLGGYGLFGIILDVQMRVVPNERYRPEMELLPADKFVDRFIEKTKDADIGMAYGRLCVVPGEKTFLRQSILTVFRQAPCPPSKMPKLSAPTLTEIRREVFRAQIGSQAGKELRWAAETKLGEQGASHYVSRNQLLNEGAGVYQEHDAGRTDILHEYFIPPAKVAQFLERAHHIIPRYPADLLNVTIRNVREDKDTLLRYADGDMFAFVMLFNQPRTPAADRLMEELTRDLIDAALAAGGRYYLPYRLHASEEQFLRAYPQAPVFFGLKRHYDGDQLFENQFFKKYGTPRE
jgi:FAD/FMN-containing dehydrogenase